MKRRFNPEELDVAIEIIEGMREDLNEDFPWKVSVNDLIDALIADIEWESEQTEIERDW